MVLNSGSRWTEEIHKYISEGLHEEDWADNWKQYYHPVRVGEHIVIVPEWEMETFEPREGDVVVMMDPGIGTYL